MSKPSPRPFRPKSGRLSVGWEDPTLKKERKINQKWFVLLGGVLGLLYLMFVVYGSAAAGG